MNLMQLALSAPLAFGAGVVVGFVVANRFRIVRREGDDEHALRPPDGR